jgi:anti-sigma regulatory factor (Ser/Thr protein kinase)
MSGYSDAVKRPAGSGRAHSELRSGFGAGARSFEPGFITLSPAWALRSYVELEPAPSAVPYARCRTRELLQEWGLAHPRELAEITELLVSELLTNAYESVVEHHLDTPIRYRLSSNRLQLLVEIWDGAAMPPPAPGTQLPPADAVSGRGLFLVRALSTRWNWYSLGHCGGKVIWAEVALAESNGACPSA